MAIHAAVELLADRSPDAWIQKFLQVNPTYGKGYALIASHLVLNYRYEEGVAYYRKAIDRDPRLWSARSQLGINLMRLGQEDEPRQQLEMCYNNGYRDKPTANSLKLLDSYKNFTVIKNAGTILKLDKKEAELLRPYIEQVLTRAIATYESKYQDEAAGPRSGGGLSQPRRTSQSALLACRVLARSASPSGQSSRWTVHRGASPGRSTGPARSGTR